ncbi:MAG TPA: hypothetical protein VEI52_13860 [Terriglobales bacterium]|nr:hypothetical protein [Terriglobales bacterium]
MKTTEAGKDHGGMATRVVQKIMKTVALFSVAVLKALSNKNSV